MGNRHGIRAWCCAFFFQAEDGIRDYKVTGVQTCALPIFNGRLSISVTDRGPGIAAEEQARIFDRFYRGGGDLTRRVKGAGIGLSLVKRIVERSEERRVGKECRSRWSPYH